MCKESHHVRKLLDIPVSDHFLGIAVDAHIIFYACLVMLVKGEGPKTWQLADWLTSGKTREFTLNFTSDDDSNRHIATKSNNMNLLPTTSRMM